MSEILHKLTKLEQEAEEFGFCWPDQEMILEQIISECREIKEANNEAHLQEEIGDLLHAAISLCIFAGFDIENTLELSGDKFARRLSSLKEVVKKEGLATLKGQSVDYMMGLWQKAKNF